MEEDPDTENPLFILAYCTVDNRPDGILRLSGKLELEVIPNTLAHNIYGKQKIEEAFNCNYEMNPEYRERIEASGLKVSGITEEGGIRIVELPGHRFFIATGFVPQLGSEEGKPHPLIIAYLKAALGD